MRLVGFPTLIIGIILMTAGSTWFTGAGTVGLILTIASGLWIGLVLALIALSIWVASDDSSKYTYFNNRYKL